MRVWYTYTLILYLYVYMFLVVEKINPFFFFLLAAPYTFVQDALLQGRFVLESFFKKGRKLHRKKKAFTMRI